MGRAQSKIAQMIRDYRETTGLSLTGLQRELDVSPSRLHILEQGWSLPSVPTLARIARFFGLTAEETGRLVLESAGSEVPGTKPFLERRSRIPRRRAA